MHKELFGIIGTVPNISEHKQWWNAEFERLGIDACFNSYPTGVGELPERLSEMYHFDRRGYIVGNALQEAIIPLLDVVDASALEKGRVECVFNRGGVITGFAGLDRQEIWNLWLPDCD